MGEIQSKPKDENAQIQQIRDILLNGTTEELRDIRNWLEDKGRLSETIDPILEDKISFTKDNFERLYGTEVDHLIDQRISESPEQILAIISPLLGRLIKKYIAHQFQLLRESIDHKIKSATSTKNWFGKIRSKIFGVKEGDLALSEYNVAVIKEIYVIRRHSGLLIGSYSIDNAIDSDMIGGMLTAIKAFVEDIITNEENKGDELEMIQYGSYKIFIQNFYNYYIAVVISGSFSSTERDILSDKMINFAEKVLSVTAESELSSGTDAVSLKLKEYFGAEK